MTTAAQITARRYDLSEPLRPARRTAEGFLEVDIVIGQAGILEYSRARGDAYDRVEYRPPEAMFAATTTESAALRPLAVGHPHAHGGFITPDNALGLVHGAVGETVERLPGDRAKMRGILYTAEAIREAEAGRLCISAGYDVPITLTPGVAPNGRAYDAVQGPQTNNHFALVWEGRSPTARMRLDAAGNEVPRDIGGTEGTMSDVKVSYPVEVLGRKIDGLPPETAALIAEAMEKLKQCLAGQEAAEQAKTDAIRERDEARGALAAMQSAPRLDEVAIQARVKERIALESLARVYRVPKADSLDDAALAKATLKAARPTLAFESEGPEFIRAALAIVRADATARRQNLDALDVAFDAEADRIQHADASDGGDFEARQAASRNKYMLTLMGGKSPS